MNSTTNVEQASDEADISTFIEGPVSGTYIPNGFDCRCNKIGNSHTSHSAVGKQVGRVQGPNTSHVVPASRPYHISIMYSGSRASRLPVNQRRCTTPGRSHTESLGAIERSSCRDNRRSPRYAGMSTLTSRRSPTDRRWYHVRSVEEESLRTSRPAQPVTTRIPKTTRRRGGTCAVAVAARLADAFNTTTHWSHSGTTTTTSLTRRGGSGPTVVPRLSTRGVNR